MSEDVQSEELFMRMFEVHHRVLVDLARVSAFEEWAALEILAMRVFANVNHGLGAMDIARALGCSFPHASRLSKKLQARGLIYERRWHQYKSLNKTVAGEEWTRAELPYLTAFTADLFSALTPDERVQMFDLLGRVRRSAS